MHEWLLRHVYLETLETYKLSQNSATFVTFLFSSIFHEVSVPFFFLFTTRANIHVYLSCS